MSTYRVWSQDRIWSSSRLAAPTLVPVENGQYEPTPSATRPWCASFFSASGGDSPIDGFLSPPRGGAIRRQIHASAGGTMCIIP